MMQHSIAQELARVFVDRQMNEADTRHQIINRLLHEVLDWPHSAVACEEKVHPGYIDITLRDSAGRALLLVEAKREGNHFSLPNTAKKPKDRLRSVRLDTIATNPAIKSAVHQAAHYCPAIGCPFACVTNGHEFILFRAFVLGRGFLEADAIVIPSLEFFSARFTEAYNLLSYQGVTVERALHKCFQTRGGAAKELRYPKHGITHYDTPFQKNPYARFLEPIARRYFGEIQAMDKKLMEHCYVFARGTQEVQDGIRTWLSDDLTRYFSLDGVQQIESARTGGKLAERVARSLSKRGAGEVLIVYGGKGAGKSTFLRRLLYHEPPQAFVLHAFPIIVDCIRAPQNREDLTRHFWEQITDAFNLDGLLERPIEELLNLFSDRFDVAKRQELAGLEAGSGDYIRERNRLVMEWKSDRLYVARRLKEYWEEQGQRAVIAFDNTDQLPAALQDHCFLSAQNIARELQCIVLISMREERYCRARTMGVLDAYQNNGFHLAAPDLVGVFTKRLRLVIRDLGLRICGDLDEVFPEDAPRDKLRRFFSACLYQFRNPRGNNALQKFLQECSRDNTRLALDFFCQFLSSGYTHAEEMVGNVRWTVIAHQVIKPMMIPQRFNYDEDKSLVPNIYQCRTPLRGSHFTMSRILALLRRGVSVAPDNAGYWRVDALLEEFNTKFGMLEDCETALDVMLQHGLIEANNRLDSYSVLKANSDEKEVIFADEVRITAFGLYMSDHLALHFTYLDLVMLDCGLADEGIYNELCRAGADERRMGIGRDKDGRLQSRLRRVELFIEYLAGEEAREKAEFVLPDDEDVVPKIQTAYLAEKPRILASARRNIDRPI